MRTLILLPLAALLACAGTKTEQGISGTSGEDGASGEAGEDGEPGADGEDGEDGADGLPCWDLDGDGEPDPEEDINGDGVVDVDDCRGDDTGGSSSGSGGVYLGSLNIMYEEQAEYFCEHYSEVLGDVNVTDYDAADLAALSCLERVVGQLGIAGGAMQDISLPNLQSVSSIFTMTAMQAEDAVFASLTSVGMLSVNAVGLYTSGPVVISFPVLTDAGTHLQFESNASDNIDFPSLVEINGDLEIRNNTNLTGLDGLSSLTTVTGGIEITSNDSLCEDDAWVFADAISVGTYVVIDANGGPCP